MEEGYIAFLISIVVFYLFAIGIGIADYIISSIALFRIARKREISHPWLAWIPVANSWTFGSIVDDFESQKGSKRKFRIILLVLGIISAALMSAMIIGLILISEYYVYGVFMSGEEAFLAFYYATLLPFSYVAIAYGALNLICLHKTHENIYPEKSIKYLVISVIVPLGYSICLLKNSNRCEEKVSE